MTVIRHSHDRLEISQGVLAMHTLVACLFVSWDGGFLGFFLLLSVSLLVCCTHIIPCTCTYIHVHVHTYMYMNNIRYNKQSNTIQHNSTTPETTLFFQRKMSCLRWDSNPRHSVPLHACTCTCMYMHVHVYVERFLPFPLYCVVLGLVVPESANISVEKELKALCRYIRTRCH